MYLYLWNEWQILPEKSFVRTLRLLLMFYTIQHLPIYIKPNLGSQITVHFVHSNLVLYITPDFWEISVCFVLDSNSDILSVSFCIFREKHG